MARIDKACSASTKINASSGNLKWINNGYRSNSWGYRKSKMATWLFRLPDKLNFTWKEKAFSGFRVNVSQWIKKWLICILYNLQLLEHALCWTGHTDIGKTTSWVSWRLLLSLASSVVRQGWQNKGIGCMRLNKMLNMITIFMIFCLTYHWLLIFVFRYKEAVLKSLMV